MLNSVMLIGNLGADPDVYDTKDGRKVATIVVATSDFGIDRDTDERIVRTEWHRVVLFGNFALRAEKNLKKGRQVFIQGKLRTRTWQDKEGIKRYTTEVVVSRADSKMFLLGRREDYDEEGVSAETKDKDEVIESIPSGTYEEENGSNDVPF